MLHQKSSVMTLQEYIAYCYACECEGIMPKSWDEINHIK